MFPENDILDSLKEQQRTLHGSIWRLQGTREH